MAQAYQTIQVRVVRTEQATPLIKRFTLESLDGAALPAFTGGSHIIVQMRDGAQQFSNAYSLMSDPGDLSCYQIGVRREDPSKGGSAFMHDKVTAGDVLSITTPNNLFALRTEAARHVLIAGGIGITPFVSQMHDLHRSGGSYELHYAFRSPEHAAFRDELQAMAQDGTGTVQCYADSLGQQLDIAGLLRGLAPQAHVYVCGPAGLINAVRSTTETVGLAPERVHWEQFAAPELKDGSGFTVVLAKSGHTVEVGADESILKAIERETSVAVECLCREGVCGTCETNILEGEAEHLDQYLSDKEKAAQRTMMICVSRARAGKLVLDL